jgi:hypothetical protein
MGGLMIGAAFKTQSFSTERNNNIELFLLLGDSNQGGPAYEADITDPDWATYYIGQQNCMTYFRVDQARTDIGAIELFDNREPVGNKRAGYPRITGSPYTLGNEASFCYTLGHDGGLPKIILKWGIGGTTLVSDWSDALSTQFLNVFAYISYIRRDLRALGYKNIIYKGVNVKLGTNDCNNALWNAANFRAAIQLFLNNSKHFWFGNCKIDWVQIHTDLRNATGWGSTNVDAARTEITAIGPGGTYEFPNVTIINHDSLAVQADHVHYTADSFIDMGVFEADSLL